ncbi:MAG: hypothetical protein M0Q94_04300 [Candidatus Cloacimonetes bacterium]|nr:hypothetical protein [Candidatus Cloacimonadota bacterium]
MTKEAFILRLKELNISQKEFSFLSKTPYSTLNNWGFCKDDKTIPVPNWVEPFLEYYEKASRFDIIARELCGKLK